MEKGRLKSTAQNICLACRDTGWILVTDSGVDEVAPCPECRSRQRLRSVLEAAEIPPRYLNRGFDIYSIHHPLQEKALRRSIEYVEQFPKVPRGILFFGPCGVGKTHLSVAILESLIREKLVSGKFVDETELLRRLQYSFGPDSPETEREVMKPLMEVDLLVWDDLGTGRPTEWVAETIRTVLNHRYTFNKQTILSTNWLLSPERGQSAGLQKVEQSLAERIGHRLYSRLMEMCEVIRIAGPDARTEIHKARLDFEEHRRRWETPEIPEGILNCPSCSTKKVKVRDSTNSPPSAIEHFLELSCLCEDCGEHFVARLFEEATRVEYPTL